MHKKKAGKLQTGSTFPKQYWLAVNGKPIICWKSSGARAILTFAGVAVESFINAILYPDVGFYL